MKTIKLAVLALAVSGLVMTSCEKSEHNPGEAQNGSGDLTMKALLDPANQEALAKALAAHFQIEATAKGANFITPFFVTDGFGVIKDLVVDTTGPFPIIVSGELGSFSAELDGNDFYRENPDGTVSVHITENHAHGEHLDFGTAVVSKGDDCKLTMNYTGVPMEICFPDPNGNLFCLNLIDLNQNPNAISFHGVGKVQADSISPWLDLSAKVLITPGSTKSLVTMDLK